nr:alpha/beta fold hydrolase [uncultured Ruminococcus sp.]
MKIKQLIVILALIALLLTGCSRQSTTSANDTAGTQGSEAVGASSSPTENPTEAETAAPTIAPANVDPDATYEYEVREIWTENNGNRIYGEAYIPITDGRSPLILFSHGLGSNHESGESYAKKVAPRGFAVYTWDFPGGSSANNENRSDGNNLEMSVMTEASDLDAIIKTAKTWDFVDTDRIFLAGGSQGGLVTAIGGVRHEDEVAGLILLYPAFGMAMLGDRYSDDMPDEIQISSMTVGKPFFKDLIGYDVRDEIPNFDKPVIIIQGSEDNLVLPSVSREAADLYPDCEYKLIEGAGHGFSGEEHDIATDYALDFLFRHI